MPTLKQNLNILKNGIPKRRSTTESTQDSEPVRPLSTRDHYERWAHFSKRQYPKWPQTEFAESEVLQDAVTAARDTPLGIIDTIARECITHWLPELIFLDFRLTNEDEDFNDDDDVDAFRALADSLRQNVFTVLNRIECSEDNAASKLKSSILEKAQNLLSGIFDTFEDELTDIEKVRYNPTHIMSISEQAIESNAHIIKHVAEPLTEARILNSSLAWDLSDIQPPPPPPRPPPLTHTPLPRKRRFSQIADSDPDPADNGQVWNSPRPEMKRQKLELKVTSTAKVLSENEDEDSASSFRLRCKALARVETVDLTEDDDDPGNEDGVRDGISDASEFPVPGAFYTGLMAVSRNIVSSFTG